MAKLVLTDAFVSINAVDLSDHVQSVEITYDADEVESTSMGDDTHKMFGGVLKNWSASVNFFQDYAAGEVDATIFAIVGTTVAVEFRSSTAAVGVTNPKFTGTALVQSYNPIAGSIGESAMAPVELRAASDLVRATA